MMNELISIIVPVYNMERYLEQCFKSVCGQTYSNIEIIAVNDGSTDSSLALLEKIALQDSRVQIISQKNQGLSAARNTGVFHAKGRYIMFVDSDDWVNEKTCEIAIGKLEEYNADVVLWPYYREYANSSKKTLFFGNQEIFWGPKECDQLLRRMIGPIDSELKQPQQLDSMITAWGKIYKKELIEGIKFVDTKKIGTEDALFNIQVFERVTSAIYIPNALSHYRKIQLSSLSHSYNPNKLSRWQEMYKCIYDELEKNNNPECCFVALNNRIALGLIGLGLNVAEDTTLSFLQKYAELIKILGNKIYEKPLKNLDLSYLPVHWKVFFWLAKARCSGLLCLLLLIMNRMRGV